MDFTGERYVPSHPGVTRSEHLHRYAVAAQFIKDKAVLDIASGEGYGADLFAKSAATVIGVDIDPDSIAYASETYGRQPNLRFLVGSADGIPLPDKSVDVVTSFETLEHHDRHQEMLSEIKRVLRPAGILLISTPNHPVYSLGGTYVNPFHVKELDKSELEMLLSENFSAVRLFGQKLSTGSFIAPLQTTSSVISVLPGIVEDNAETYIPPLYLPKYFFAVCSDSEINVEGGMTSLYFDEFNDSLELALSHATQQIEQAQSTIRSMESSVFWRVREKWWRLRNLKRWLLAVPLVGLTILGILRMKSQQEC